MESWICYGIEGPGETRRLCDELPSRQVVGGGHRFGLGIPEQPASAITLRHVTIEADRGFDLADVRDVVFEGAAIKTPDGKPLSLDNAEVMWNGKKIDGPATTPAR